MFHFIKDKWRPCSVLVKQQEQLRVLVYSRCRLREIHIKNHDFFSRFIQLCKRCTSMWRFFLGKKLCKNDNKVILKKSSSKRYEKSKCHISWFQASRTPRCWLWRFEQISGNRKYATQTFSIVEISSWNISHYLASSIPDRLDQVFFKGTVHDISNDSQFIAQLTTIPLNSFSA